MLSEVNEVYHKNKLTPAMLVIGLDAILHDNFQYAKERCIWLDREQFLEEIGTIYRRCEELLRKAQDRPYGIGSEWLHEAETSCSSFFEHYAFCRDRVKNPMIVRINQFEPDEYVWYLIQDETSLCCLQLCDFG